MTYPQTYKQHRTHLRYAPAYLVNMTYGTADHTRPVNAGC